MHSNFTHRTLAFTLVESIYCVNLENISLYKTPRFSICEGTIIIRFSRQCTILVDLARQKKQREATTSLMRKITAQLYKSHSVISNSARNRFLNFQPRRNENFVYEYENFVLHFFLRIFTIANTDRSFHIWIKFPTVAFHFYSETNFKERNCQPVTNEIRKVWKILWDLQLQLSINFW